MFLVGGTRNIHGAISALVPHDRTGLFIEQGEGFGNDTIERECALASAEDEHS